MTKLYSRIFGSANSNFSKSTLWVFSRKQQHFGCRLRLARGIEPTPFLLSLHCECCKRRLPKCISDRLLVTVSTSHRRCRTTLTLADSQSESMWLDRLHEQAITRPLPYDELIGVYRRVPEVWSLQSPQLRLCRLIQPSKADHSLSPTNATVRR